MSGTPENIIGDNGDESVTGRGEEIRVAHYLS